MKKQNPTQFIIGIILALGAAVLTDFSVLEGRMRF